MPTILIAGVAGFIGSSFARHLLATRPDCVLVGVDYLSSASVYATIAPLVDAGQLRFHRVDINDTAAMSQLYREERIDRVINFAAESHNDRAILDPTPFMLSNALGAQQLLEVSRQRGVARHVHVSTIEVYGEQAPGDPPFTAASPLNAKTPYAAAKAAGDMMVRAYMQTYPSMDIVLTHAGNNYGPYQFPEKLIPLSIIRVLSGQPVPLYGDGLQERDWIFVDDHCAALATLLLHPERLGASGPARPDQLPIFDVSSRMVLSNLQLITAILQALGRSPEEWVSFVTDRPNHDRRYVIDPSRVEVELGFKAQVTMQEGIARTVKWYIDNTDWWHPIVKSKQRLSFDWSQLRVSGR